MHALYWTYAAQAARGDDCPETYAPTENGKTTTKTRQVRRTRCTYVSGTVFNAFDDLLILASNSLPRRFAERLEPWDLENLVSYADEYRGSFQAQRTRSTWPRASKAPAASWMWAFARPWGRSRRRRPGHPRAQDAV